MKITAGGRTNMGMRLGHYEAGRQLGGGGMTTVYQAEDTHLGRAVALKVVTLPPDVSPAHRQELLTRWRREARALSHLSHPNIVTVYDVGEQDGQDYLVMEYLDGKNLGRVLEHGPLAVAEASDVLAQVASGLDAVHAQGLVLRGLKPSKVMRLPDGRAKLTSLGLARHTDDTMVTQAGERVGSPVFMAPEQVRGGEATPATDLWALGALLYAMLAGCPPFAGPTVDALLYQILSGQPPPVPGLSAPLQQVVTKALQKDPTKRFQSAGEMAAAVRSALDSGVSESAPRLTPTSRHRIPKSPLVWAAPLVLVIALLSFAFVKWPAGRRPPVMARAAPTPAPVIRRLAPAPRHKTSVPRRTHALPHRPQARPHHHHHHRRHHPRHRRRRHD